MHPKAKKRIAILALAATVIGLAGGGAFAYRKLSIRAEFAASRVEGLKASADGRHAEAIEPLLKYIERSPNDVEVLSAFAKSREQVPLAGGAQLRAVLGTLQRVVSLDGGRTDERARLAMLLSDFGQLPEALEQADRVLAARPGDKIGLAVKAVALQRLRRPADGEAAAMAWAEGAPEDVRALAMALASARENKATPEKLAALAKRLEGMAKSDLGLATVRGTAALLAGDTEGARRWWREGSKIDPTTPDEAIFVADQLRGLGLAMESAEYLVRAAELGKLRSGKLLPARRLLELERFDLLARLLGSVKVDDAETPPEMLSMKAIALAGTGDVAGADGAVKSLAARKGKGDEAWTLVTEAFLGRGQADAETTKKVVTEAITEGENAPVLALVLADAVGRLGETERAVRVLDNLAEASPAWSRPLERKASFLSAAGQLEAAHAAALEAARRGPNDPRALTTLARVWSAAVEAGILNNRAELAKFLDQLSAAMPGDQSTAAMRIVTLARVGKAEEARKVAGQVLAAAKAAPGPAWGDVLLRVATASAAAGLGGEIELLDAAEGYGGVTPNSALTRALLGASTGRGADAVARFERERKSDGPAAKEWAMAWAATLDATGDPRALAAWTHAAETYKDALPVQREVLNSRTGRSDLPLRRATIERLKAIMGDASPTYRMEEAALALDQSDTTPAKLTEISDKLGELVRSSPGNTQARILLARTLERNGGVGMAIEQLRAVSKSAPEAGTVSLMLADLYQKRGDYAAAERELDDAVKRMGSGQSRGAAMLLAQQGDVDKALDALKQAGSDAPDPLKVRLLRQKNDLPAAEVEARRVATASPDLGSIRVLAEILRARGNTAEAAKTLQLLDGIKLDPGMKELALTDFHLRFFDLENALASATQATDKAPENAATWQALLTVRSALGDIAGAIKTVEAAAAKHPNVALFTAQQSRLDVMKSAANDPVLTPVVISLLQNPNDQAMLEALRTPTSGAISEGGPGAAVGRVRELAAKYPLSQPVQMMAVRRMLQLNQLTEAASLAARAGQTFPTSSEAPATAAGAYASAGDWTSALTQAREWKTRSGANALPADLAVSEALIRLRRFDEAVAVVDPYVKNFSMDRRAHLPAVFRKAEALSLAGRDDAAATVLATITKGDPATWAGWLGYASDRLPPEKAVAWAKRAESSAEGGDAGLAWQAAIVRANALTQMKSPVAAEARDKLAALARAPGRGGEYLASAALAYDQADDLPQAETLYREAMAAGINGVAVKNNMAMILIRKGGAAPEALKLAQEVVAAAPNVSTFLDTLATTQAAAGDLDQAEASLVKAVNLDPATAEWRIHLAEIQLKAGKTADAKATVDGFEFVRPEGLSESLKARLAAVRNAVRQPG